MKLTIDLPNDSVNGLERKLIHTELRISENLEMSQSAKVEYYKGGLLITDAIDSDLSLTQTQKDQRKRMYEGIRYSNSTNNAFVDPATGDEILPGPSGFDTEKPMVTELEFWQNMPTAFFTGKNLESIAPGNGWKEGNLLSELVYNAIRFSMLKMVERSRI
jgi:hypothetical protein